eukprot:768241-Hanusia_phi.AAC.2
MMTKMPFMLILMLLLTTMTTMQYNDHHNDNDDNDNESDDGYDDGHDEDYDGDDGDEMIELKDYNDDDAYSIDGALTSGGALRNGECQDDCVVAHFDSREDISTLTALRDVTVIVTNLPHGRFLKASSSSCSLLLLLLMFVKSQLPYEGYVRDIVKNLVRAGRERYMRKVKTILNKVRGEERRGEEERERRRGEGRREEEEKRKRRGDERRGRERGEGRRREERKRERGGEKERGEERIKGGEGVNDFPALDDMSCDVFHVVNAKKMRMTFAYGPSWVA